MIVIVACGNSKLSVPSEAQDMYIGGYFKMCMRYARSLVPADKIFILSGKYGLLRLTDPIEPYELKLGQQGAIVWTVVAKQAADLGIAGQTVMMLGGAKYTALCRLVWQSVLDPLPKRKFGYQMQWIKRRLDVQNQQAIHV